MSEALCASTGAPAIGTCERCGQFVCADCQRVEAAVSLCLACWSRPELRLEPSPRAKRALWLALGGLHGLLPLLLISLWVAGRELQAIEAGRAPTAGRPWVVTARLIAGAGGALWAVLLAKWLSAM